MIENLIQEIKGAAGLLEAIHKDHERLREAFLNPDVNKGYLNTRIQAVIDDYKATIEFKIKKLNEIAREYETAKKWKEYI